MNKLTTINIKAGQILFPGLILAQLIIMIYAFSYGGMMVLITVLTGGIILPFAIAAYVSRLNREKHLKKISPGITISIALLIITPILFPLFFDKELIYLSLVGIAVGIGYWIFRLRLEIHLLIFNSISSLILILLLIGWIFGGD